MTDQLLAELRKMRSTRTNLGLLAGMIAITILTVLLVVLSASDAELSDHDHQHAVLSAGTNAALFATLIGVMAITSEFRHGTIRPTFVVTPHRARVIGAKVISSLVMGLLFGLVGIALSFGIGYGITLARGGQLVLETSHILLLVLGTLAMTALWAAIGVGVGALVKNQVFAVIAVIAWTGIIDQILGGAVPGVGRYTPIGVSSSLTADPAHYLVAPLFGGLLLLAYTIVFVTAGQFFVARRDVT